MKNKLSKSTLVLIATLLTINSAKASDVSQLQLQDLQTQLQDLKIKISKVETDAKEQKKATNPFSFGNNSFNPQIGVVLNGRFIDSSNDDSKNKIAGFGLGDGAANNENKGFSLGESEVKFASNVDDLFRASLTVAFGDDGVETEEAYIQTISLPYSLNIKAGRFLADIGYLNVLHTHHDNFSERPLPYQVFLDGAYNDDGAQLSIVFPTKIYLEAIAGAYAGNKFPAGGRANNNGAGAYALSLKTGGDIFGNGANGGVNGGSFVVGVSYLGSKAGSDRRETADGANSLKFQGQNDLYIAHLKYNWSPNGNNAQKEFILQGEYFLRREDGNYESLDDQDVSQGSANFKGNQSGWYTEAVYKFLPKWRAGYRYSKLNATSGNKIDAVLANTTLNSQGLNASTNSYMIDFTNSEFSRIRFEYGTQRQVASARGNYDQNETFTLQYIVVLGAHPAHKF